MSFYGHKIYHHFLSVISQIHSQLPQIRLHFISPGKFRSCCQQLIQTLFQQMTPTSFLLLFQQFTVYHRTPTSIRFFQYVALYIVLHGLENSITFSFQTLQVSLYVPCYVLPFLIFYDLLFMSYLLAFCFFIAVI